MHHSYDSEITVYHVLIISLNYFRTNNKYTFLEPIINTRIIHTSILQLNLAVAELMPLDLGLTLGEPINISIIQESNPMTFSKSKLPSV